MTGIYHIKGSLTHLQALQISSVFGITWKKRNWSLRWFKDIWRKNICYGMVSKNVGFVFHETHCIYIIQYIIQFEGKWILNNDARTVTSDQTVCNMKGDSQAYLNIKGEFHPKLLLLLCKVYKNSFPLVLLFLHCEKQVESCGQKSYLYYPSLGSNRALSSWCMLMSQTRWASVCETVCMQNFIRFYRKQLSIDFNPILVQW